MGDLQSVTDLTGTMSQTDINSQNISNIIDELNRLEDSLGVLGQTFSISTILNESYTVTNTDIENNYINLSFPHGLSFVPIVTGSVSITADGSIRILPAFVHGPTQTYFGASFSLSIVVESVDDVNVNLRVDIIDGLGVSILSSNFGQPFNFILYCQQQPASTS